ncbi:MAG TPA: SagB family peptide dehydrogenase [Steroidobacteraceae bacterium]|nr:SagB family peptide dehydrogenase [Steroidobacteraceae bacterium]
MTGVGRLISARCQSAYWVGAELRIVNYLTRRTFRADPVTLEVIRFFADPKTIREAMREFRLYTHASVGEAIVQMLAAGILLQCDSPQWAQDDLLDRSWKPWLPEAALHFLTKDTAYAGADWSSEQILQIVSKGPSPLLYKKTRSAESVQLPRAGRPRDAFFDTLHARRTRREFADSAVPLETVATLLHTTWGVQGYHTTEHFGELPLKTSPSGGARSPIEVYLLALGVVGLDPGLYHYDTRGHVLDKISSQQDPARARAYCADQPYAGEAAALFIMTAVFARTMWKYPHPRAYRVVLLDAGHLGQTFCLTATRLGLACFTTAALKDTLIEEDLGVDGISESVVYVAGMGMPLCQ